MSANSTFHQYLVENLRTLIREGTFKPGAKFLTEREIAERYDTSRPTANKALSSLVSAGLLEVRRGAGTFVCEGVLNYDLEKLVSFTEKAKAVGKKPGTELLEYKLITAAESPGVVAEALRVRGQEHIIYMERIRLADRNPVIYERRYVVAQLCPEMSRTDAKHSLYACWTDKCGLVITGADETIRAVNISKAEAALLHVPPSTACFKIIATGYVSGKTPLWHEETLYRADLYEFRNRISGLSGSHLASGMR
jgi:GntR family transcriptional regulator